jgi:AbrB family looped-hinge helix DNA binding protein
MEKKMKKNCMVPSIYDFATVGERGQIVIPAKARKDFNIKPKDKLMMIAGPGGHALIIVKAEQLTAMADQMIKNVGAIRQKMGGKS